MKIQLVYRLAVSVRRLVVSITKNKSLRLFIQKSGALRLLSPALIDWLSGSSVSPADRPVYFLGEKLISPNEWRERVAMLPEKKLIDGDSLGKNAEIGRVASTPIVTVLVSLYKSDEYIERFLDTLLNQTMFSRCEVLIVSVQPTNAVRAVLSNRLSEMKQVRIIEVSELIGIYDAWNLALSCTKSKYITNMNADDLRSPDSIEKQIETLDSTGADVAYQDVFYSYEQGLTFDQIAELNVRSNLPVGSLKLLAQGINFPHNAPMWKRELHERVGVFDVEFKSAGDHDFWIRCALAGAVFVKCESIHVSYFINPQGMSTKKNSPGVVEGKKILEKYRKYA